MKRLLNGLVEVPALVVICAAAVWLCSKVFPCMTHLSARVDQGEGEWMVVVLFLVLMFVVVVPLLLTIIVSGVMAVFILCGAGPHFLLRKFAAGSVLMTDNSRVVRYLGEDEYSWRWSPEAKLACEPLSSQNNVSLTSRPITANPKVRELGMYLSVRVKTEDQQALQRVIDLDRPDNWGSLVSSELYDLAESCSTELAEFSNPLRPEQQVRFNQLVCQKLGDRLSCCGLQILEASFTLN